MVVNEHASRGVAYLGEVTGLLQSIRRADSTGGVWEAADLQWWWRRHRPTDEIDQSFWTDASGKTVAGAIRTDWGRRIGLDVIIHPQCDAEVVAEIWQRALKLVQNLESVEVMIDAANTTASEVLAEHGFGDTGQRGGSAWRGAEPIPGAEPPVGYRLADRSDEPQGKHHMDVRMTAPIEQRLKETSLYRPDLDLSVLAADGSIAAYGIFWFDPTTSVGFVEPMGTNMEHRRKGLASWVLARGVNRLVSLGATRVKVNYEVGNAAAERFYFSAGFVHATTTAMYVRNNGEA